MAIITSFSALLSYLFDTQVPLTVPDLSNIKYTQKKKREHPHLLAFTTAAPRPSGCPMAHHHNAECAGFVDGCPRMMSFLLLLLATTVSGQTREEERAKKIVASTTWALSGWSPISKGPLTKCMYIFVYIFSL